MAQLKPKVKKLYYSIGEVSNQTGLKAYVLRYWETEFNQLNPSKNRAGNRTYRQKDIDVVIKIKNLLYDKKFTIEGAKKILSSKKNVDIETSVSNKNRKNINMDKLDIIRSELKSILDIINQK